MSFKINTIASIKLHIGVSEVVIHVNINLKLNCIYNVVINHLIKTHIFNVQ